MAKLLRRMASQTSLHKTYKPIFVQKISRVAFDKHTGNVFDELSHFELYTFFTAHMAASYPNQNKEQQQSPYRSFRLDHFSST